MRGLLTAAALWLCVCGMTPSKEWLPSAPDLERAAEPCRTYSRSHSYSQPKRSSHAKTEFKHAHPCPSTGKGTGSCPGYIIDHVTALKRGGADAPGNMQWQTTPDAKAKDK